MKKFSYLLVLIFALSVLSACGGNTVQEAAGNVAAAGAVFYQEATGYYQEGVRNEAGITGAQKAWEVTYNSGLNIVRDQNPIADDCFTNIAEVTRGALAGVFDSPTPNSTETISSGEEPTGVVNSDALISALSLNQTYPDTSACQEAKINVQRSISAWRQDSLDRSLDLYDRIRVYNIFLHDSVKNNVLNQLIREHSGEFANINIDPNFIGFPTDQLSVTLRTKDMCDMIREDHSGDVMWGATWERAFGTCTLTRMAALRFLERPFVSEEVSNRIDTGFDAGAFDTVPTPTALSSNQ